MNHANFIFPWTCEWGVTSSPLSLLERMFQFRGNHCTPLAYLASPMSLRYLHLQKQSGWLLRIIPPEFPGSHIHLHTCAGTHPCTQSTWLHLYFCHACVLCMSAFSDVLTPELLPTTLHKIWQHVSQCLQIYADDLCRVQWHTSKREILIKYITDLCFYHISFTEEKNEVLI